MQKQPGAGDLASHGARDPAKIGTEAAAWICGMRPFVPNRVSADMITGHDDLFTAIASGESGAFALLMDPWRAELERYALRMAKGNLGLAEEVMQEAQLKAYRSIHAGARPESTRAWLYTIVRNCALNAVRDARDGEPLPEDCQGSPCPDPAARAAELHEWMDWLMGAIVALPSRQRDALVASAFEGRSQQEIAGSMGTTVPAVKTLLHRARRTLEAAQPSSLATVPASLLVLARRAGTHARGLLAAKVGTKGMAAAGWQVLVAATVATSVAIVAHGGAGPVLASTLKPSGGVQAPMPNKQRPTRLGTTGHRNHEPPPATIRREARHAVRACTTGHALPRRLSRGALRYAARHLSEDEREYTECERTFLHAEFGRSQVHRHRHRGKHSAHKAG